MCSVATWCFMVRTWLSESPFACSLSFSATTDALTAEGLLLEEVVVEDICSLCICPVSSWTESGADVDLPLLLSDDLVVAVFPGYGVLGGRGM